MRHNELKSSNESSVDRELDIALTKYAAAEPRLGLETRILAKVRGESRQEAGKSFWNWATAVAVVAIIAAVMMTWRFEKVRHDSASHQAVTPFRKSSQPQVEEGRSIAPVQPRANSWHEVKRRVQITRHNVADNYPKLEQFPSPQPLSEQEQLLANYVAQYPTDAAQIAQARAKALLRDSEEEFAMTSTGTR